MEDKGAYVFLSKFKWIFILALIFGVFGIIGFGIYSNYMINKNTDNLTDYLLKEGFKKSDDGNYIKSVSNHNEDIQYIYTASSKSILKNITTIIDGENKYISLIFKSDNMIEGTLQFHGLNRNNKYGNLLLNSSYLIGSKKFDCKIITNDNFDMQCDELSNESLEFAKEIENWIDKGDFDTKYIK